MTATEPQTKPDTKPEAKSPADKVAEAKAKADQKKGVKTEEEKREYSAPVYDVEMVDELPEGLPSAGRPGRRDMFKNLFAKVKEANGTWVRLATYKTAAGARNTVKAISKGEREIDNPEDYEVTSRKIANQEDPTGKPWSQLFARYVGGNK